MEHSDTDVTDSSQGFGFLEIGKQGLLHLRIMTGVSAVFRRGFHSNGRLGTWVEHMGQVVSLFGAFNSFLLKH